MKSYAAVERFEGSFIVCELELIELEASCNIDYCDRETQMVDIPLSEVLNCVGNVVPGDILVVEHDGETVNQVLGKAFGEKQRRIEYLRQLL